ncbi:MAG: helix-turn-helix transcriptional regulator [Lachnospiraceae bacterium]|jgi:transcriptional regulator with XRE-family HTH domain|nr:helix-turn-helix transcriptional regulator [Lachnospiraceae bacterium]
MEFNKKLYDLRKKSGISQEELANEVNVTRQTISKWELGESTPDMEKMIALSNYFDITLDELVLGRKPFSFEEKKEETAVTQIRNSKVFTQVNQKKIRKGLKITGIIAVIILSIDIISMIIYFVINGVPQ